MNITSLNSEYEKIIKPVQRMLDRKFRAIDELTREDIASAAIAYAYMYMDSQGKDFDVKDWTSLSCWKASRLALSEIRRQKRELVSLTLDNPFVNDEGDESDDSSATDFTSSSIASTIAGTISAKVTFTPVPMRHKR